MSRKTPRASNLSVPCGLDHSFHEFIHGGQVRSRFQTRNGLIEQRSRGVHARDGPVGRAHKYDLLFGEEFQMPMVRLLFRLQGQHLVSHEFDGQLAILHHDRAVQVLPLAPVEPEIAAELFGCDPRLQ